MARLQLQQQQGDPISKAMATIMMMMCKLAVGRLISTLAKAPDWNGYWVRLWPTDAMGRANINTTVPAFICAASVHTCIYLYMAEFSLLHCCQVQSVRQSSSSRPFDAISAAQG